MHAKSQVTIMIILALVIFIAVGFIIYLMKSAVEQKTVETVKGSQGSAIDTNPVRQYISK